MASFIFSSSISSGFCPNAILFIIVPSKTKACCGM